MEIGKKKNNLSDSPSNDALPKSLKLVSVT